MKRLNYYLLIGLTLVALGCKKHGPDSPDPTPKVAVASVSVAPVSLELIVGKTGSLNATVLPADASDPSVSWSSSDPEVATVSAEGVVTGVALGTATVTVKTSEGGKTATCTVTVVARTDLIRYKTSNGTILTPNSYATIGIPVSNTYEDGWGVMTFDHSLTALGNRNFYNCNLLQEIILPETVTGVGKECFRGCTSLESITLPSSLMTVGEEAFYNCYSLKKIDLPGTLASVGTGAFSRCSKLGSFEVTGGASAFQVSADGRCLLLDSSLVAFAPAGLTEYTLPSTVTAIEASAMKYCAELQSLTIPASVTAIGEYAFLNCSALTVVTLPATTPPALADKNAFDGTASLLRIYVPASAVSAYKTADGWKSFASRILAVPSFS